MEDEDGVLRGHTGWVLSLVLADGNRVWSASADGKVRVWDGATGACVSELDSQPTPGTDVGPGAVSCLVLAASGVWGGTTTGVLHVWDTETHKLVRQLGHEDMLFPQEPRSDQHDGGIDALIEHGGRVLSGCSDGVIRVWDAKSFEFERALEGHSEGVFTFCHAGATKIVSGSSDGSIRIWDTTTWQCDNIVDVGEDCHIYSVAYFGNRIFSTSGEGTISVWNMDTWECERELEGHGVWEETEDASIHQKTPVFALCIDSKRRKMVSGSADRTLRVWDLDSWGCENVLQGHKETVWACALDAERGEVWSGSGDCTIRRWSLESM